MMEVMPCIGSLACVIVGLVIVVAFILAIYEGATSKPGECRKCGRQNREGAKFCARCGRGVPTW